MKKLLEPIIHWYMTQLDAHGYPLIVLLMAAESSILPLPSEVIIPPAAHLAYTGQNANLTIAGIIIAWTVGSWLGATIMYWVARAGGRPLLARYGAYARITPEKIEGAERWAKKFGSM